MLSIRLVAITALTLAACGQPAEEAKIIGVWQCNPRNGKVWRMGANEATVFETDKDVEIEGKTLPTGKYSLFGLGVNDDFTLIFNKAWNIWGTQYDQNKEQDALRVPVKSKITKTNQELLTYAIDKDGKVTMLWGNMEVKFKVK